MFRIFDSKEKRWVKEGIYLAPNNDLFMSKRTMFGTGKLSLVSDRRYTWHRDIGLNDMNNHLIFEGDICKIEHFDVIGVIAYAPECAAYYLFDDKNLEYYPLNEEYCKQIEIIGNVLENNDLLIFEDEIEIEDNIKEGE